MRVGTGTIELLTLTILVAALLWLAHRKGWTLGGRRYGAGSFLPSPAPSASRTARVVEATVLGACATIILAIASTSQNTGGLLLMLDELNPQYATANVIMFLCALAGAVVAILIARSGRSILATITMAVVLIGYGFVLNGGSYAGSWFLAKQMTEPAVKYTINISKANVEGAELWVNGVYLGKLPYTATLDEFEAKVPYWPQPPADYRTDKVETPRYDPMGTSTSVGQRWINFDRPSRGNDIHSNPEQKTYYARVRYAGEWGVATGNSGGSGGGARASSNFSVTFPEREKRLAVLLNKARLADYRVGPEWFQAIETYNEDGWIALRNAADNEPRMMEVFDAWAMWRYGLDKVTDAEMAWQTFERIGEEADVQQQYLTPSVAGRAVELLVPKLPQERLLDKACKLIRNTGSFQYFKWDMNGRLQFGYSQRPGGVSLGRGSETSFSGGRIGSPEFPMSGFPVTHAVWMLYQSQPNVIQRRIVPEIIRWQYQAGLATPLVVAACFGGPDIDQFLLRQNWHADPRQLEREERVWLMGRDMNKWLYLLAYLNDDAGREFRRRHAGTVMDLADKFYKDGFLSWQASIDFVFMDPWLAKEYWPRFARLAREKSPDFALETQWRYLQQMGSHATPAMYVEAWKDTDKLDATNDGFRVLGELEPQMRRAVAEALIQRVQSDDSNLKADDRVGEGSDREGTRRRTLSELEAYRAGNPKSDKPYLLKQLKEGNPDEQERLRKNIPLWLAHTQPDSPQVEVLTRSEDPDLRLMVMGAMREYATPAHQQLLEQLLQDPAPAVQAAAKDVAAQLKMLAAESPSQYASNVPFAATEPTTAATQGESK